MRSSDFPPGNDAQSYANKVRQVFDGAAERADDRDDEDWYGSVVAAKELWEEEYLPDCGTAASMLASAIDATIETEADRHGFVVAWTRTLGAVLGLLDGTGPLAVLAAAEGKKLTAREAARMAAVALLVQRNDQIKQRHLAAILVSGAVESEFAEAVAIVAAADPDAGRIAREALARLSEPAKTIRAAQTGATEVVETLDLAERAVTAAERLANVAEKAATSGHQIAKAATRGADALGRGVAAVLDEVDRGFDTADTIAGRAERSLRRARRRDR